jgi:hypothetical protein
VVPTFCSIKRSYELPPLIKPREWDGDKLRWPNIQNMDYDTTSNNFEHQPIKRSFPTQHNTPNTTLPPTQKHAAAYFTLTSHTPPALNISATDIFLTTDASNNLLNFGFC